MVPGISVPTTTCAPGCASSRPSARIVLGTGTVAGFCARAGAESQAMASAAAAPSDARMVMVREVMRSLLPKQDSRGDARFGEQLSVGDAQHSITHGAHPRVVRDDEQGAVLPASQPAEQLQHLATDLGVEVGRRLVGEEDRGAVAKRPGDGDALLLPAGKIAGQEVPAVGETDGADERFRFLARLRPANPLHVERVLDVLHRGERREQVELLEDETDALASHRGKPLGTGGIDAHAVDRDLAVRGGEDAAEDGEQGGLPRPRRALERHYLARVQIERHAPEDLDLFAAFLERLHYFMSGQHWHGSSSPTKTRPGSIRATLVKESSEAATQKTTVPTSTAAMNEGCRMTLKPAPATAGRRSNAGMAPST